MDASTQRDTIQPVFVPYVGDRVNVTSLEDRNHVKESDLLDQEHCELF